MSNRFDVSASRSETRNTAVRPSIMSVYMRQVRSRRTIGDVSADSSTRSELPISFLRVSSFHLLADHGIFHQNHRRFPFNCRVLQYSRIRTRLQSPISRAFLDSTDGFARDALFAIVI